MSTTLGFLIRDGLESDTAACLELDLSYSTEFVWQMNILEEGNGWQITFRTERLPRPLETSYPADAARLKLLIEAGECFLVAVNRDQPEILAYLAMRSDLISRTAHVYDLVVARAFRRRHVGTRLLNVARQWARQRQLVRMTIEVQTRNYPGILFCQQSGFQFSGFNDHYLPNQDIAVFFSQSLR